MSDPGDPPGEQVEATTGESESGRSRATRRGGRGRGRRRRLPQIESRWMWMTLGAIGVVLLAWVLALTVTAEDPGGTPSAPPSAGPTGAQGTLLIQARNSEDVGVDNMLIAAGGDRPGAQLLVPSRLLVDVSGSGQQTLGRTTRLLDVRAGQNALQRMLAVRIDGTLTLSRLALAGMVDFVGGVTVTSQEPLVQVDPRTGVESVLVPAGTHHLSGTQAADYALAWPESGSETVRLERYSDVMTATIGALPDSPLQVEQMLTSLGGSASTTTSTSQVAAVLLQLRAAIQADDQQVQVLPTAGGKALSLVRVDLAKANPVAATLFPDAVMPGSPPSSRTPPGRVLVYEGLAEGVRMPGARDAVVGSGFVFLNAGNAATLTSGATKVLIPDGTSAARSVGARLAEALGVPGTAVSVSDSLREVADAAVVLGADFEP